MNVLVTGGAGYIGSHACKALSQAKHLPVTYDNLSHGHDWAVKWGPFERGDITDTARLVDVIRRHRIDAVMHFAALCYVGESVEKPDLYYQNNVVGSLSLLNALEQTGVKRLVFSSTCATYGLPARVPIGETFPQNPVNPYGNTKLCMERMMADFDKAYGISFISLRYFNAAGADPDGEIGEAHEPETHLIPSAIEAALGKRRLLTITGDDYPTPDGTCVRDYIHVADLASAHVLALESLQAGSPSTAYNLGNGVGFSNYQVVRELERVAARKIPVEVGERRPGDPPILVADSTKAKKELGWKPRYHDLATIIETAWRWAQQGR